MMDVSGGIAVPTITEDDLKQFHAQHFSGTALPQQFFINAEGNEDEYENEGEDELGYYSDGVKRTLTDTQISIFRHSELQRILWREAGEYTGPIFPTRPKHGQTKTRAKIKNKANEKSATQKALTATPGDEISADRPPPEEGSEEVSKDSPASAAASSGKKKKKKKPKKKSAGRIAYEASRVYKKGLERQAELKRRNSSSPEAETTHDAKKVKSSGTGAGGLAREEDEGTDKAGERHDPADFRAEGEEFTYRRLARDEDDVPNVSVDLDY